MFKPTGTRLLVKRIEPKDTTEGGIHIPDQAKEKGQDGVIIECGDIVVQCEHCGAEEPTRFAKDDHILFGKYAGTPVIIDGEECVVIEEEDVLGIYKKDSAAEAANALLRNE